jgi:hypothetical protein
VITIDAPGDVVPVQLTLEQGGLVSGSIAQTAGTDRSFVLYATPADRYEATDRVWAYTPQLPVPFGIPGLADGDYKIGAYDGSPGWDDVNTPPAGTIWYPGTTSWDAAGVVEIRNAGSVTGLVIPAP